MVQKSRNWTFDTFSTCFDPFQIARENRHLINFFCVATYSYHCSQKQYYKGWIQFNSEHRIGGVMQIFNRSLILESCTSWDFDYNLVYSLSDSEEYNFRSFGIFELYSREQRVVQYFIF